MALNFAALAPEYARTWRAMTLRADTKPTFDGVARRLYAHRQAYEQVAALTGVPASVIAVIHERESDADFATHLHNGDPLTARTRHVPAGRPVNGDPPFSWTESAVDALRYQGLDGIAPADWTIERSLFVLEGYNGWGYHAHGIRSPYIWAGTDQQQSGKYVSDGVFDPNVMDVQLGCAGLLCALWTIDPVWRLPMAGEPPIVVPVPAPVPPKPLPPPMPPDVEPPLPRPRPPLPPSAPPPVSLGPIAGLIAAFVAALVVFRDHVAEWLHHVFPFLFGN